MEHKWGTWVVSKSLNKNHPNDEKSNKSSITNTHISAMHLYYASFSAMKNHRSAQKCSQFCPGPRSASLPRRTKLSPITTQERSWSHTSDHSAQILLKHCQGHNGPRISALTKVITFKSICKLIKIQPRNLDQT